MNIRIYQVNMKRDTNNVAFMRYELLEKLQGSQAVNAKIYDKVFDGEVDCQTLEDVYQMFNLNHPESSAEVDGKSDKGISKSAEEMLNYMVQNPDFLQKFKVLLGVGN